MPPTCTVCRHPDRRQVDAWLIDHLPFRTIVDRTALSKGALIRHYDDHLPETLAQAKAAAEVARADDLLTQVKALRGKAIQLLQRAEANGDYRTALAGIREARGCIELLLEVEGRLDRRPTINLVVSVEWQQCRALLLTALQPYPDARMAVAAALLAAESPNGH
jgi:hypothetical protein